VVRVDNKQATPRFSGGLWYWGSFFIVWVVKTIILRYGGYQLHDKLKPCFIGMVFGGVVVHALQMILAVVL
jgi:hypothetical protein